MPTTNSLLSAPRDQALLQLGCTLRDSGYSFTTVTPATHARVNSRPENAWARDLRDVFGWSRSDVTGQWAMPNASLYF